MFRDNDSNHSPLDEMYRDNDPNHPRLDDHPNLTVTPTVP